MIQWAHGLQAIVGSGMDFFYRALSRARLGEGEVGDWTTSGFNLKVSFRNFCSSGNFHRVWIQEPSSLQPLQQRGDSWGLNVEIFKGVKYHSWVTFWVMSQREVQPEAPYIVFSAHRLSEEVYCRPKSHSHLVMGRDFSNVCISWRRLQEWNAFFFLLRDRDLC